MDEGQKQKQAEQLAKVKAIFEDGIATINGRDYEFTKTTHKQRRKVFAFYTRVAGQIARHDFGFLDSPEWDAIEALIGGMVLFNDVQLSKQPNHWDEHAADYLQFVASALPTISYPFIAGNPTD